MLRLELSGEALATYREAMAKVRRDAGEPLDDEAALVLMSRQILEGPRDAGRSSYQVALTVCERCRRGTQQGRGELVEVSPAVVEMAECDGQHIGHIETSSELDAHVGAEKTAEPTRAKQTVPPALRREVLRRDGGRCQVPGCRHATFVDVHHLRARSEGGKHTRDNLITLCCAHHAALHAWKLFIERTPSGGLIVRHADGTAYGHALAPASVEVRAKAQRFLVELGFRESETKRALARVALHPDVTLEELVRQALRELAPDRHSPDGSGGGAGRQRRVTSPTTSSR